MATTGGGSKSKQSYWEGENSATLFPAIVQKDNIFATQFHPEKSHNAGLKLLENWAANL